MMFARFTWALYGLSLMVGFGVYLRGFMAFKSPVEGYATWDKTDLEPTETTRERFPATFQRLVIILIDALRADFVLPIEGAQLPQMDFVKKLILENRTTSFLAKAHPPTVTLPRIKALTTGDIPGFVDVVMNFDSASLQEDNIITQLRRDDRKLVFYGDDTWIRLFPDSFLRQEGTTSFFVTDYTEVDQNVTRHLKSELVAKDWDVLILHYLGLDHIGHLAGPYSPLIKPKLKEMDDVVKRIYRSLLKQDAMSGERSLLLLCGDHGMSDHGSHGGSSAHEVDIPFVFLSSLWDDGDGQPFHADETFSQVDLVPTIALLLGIPIPQNSLGHIISSALRGYSLSQQLSALYINARQLLTVFKESISKWEKESAYIALNQTMTAHEAFVSEDHRSTTSQSLGLNIQARYIKSLKDMREKIAESLTKYDLHAMGIGIVTLWLTLSSLLLHSVTMTHQICSNMVTGLISCIVLAFFIGAHIFLCTSIYASPALCDSGSIHINTGVMIIICGSLLCFCMNASSADFEKLWHVSAYSVMSWFLLIGTAAQSLTLMASSFVEEEHQTWYLFVTTIPLFLALRLIKYAFENQNKPSENEKTGTRAGKYSLYEYKSAGVEEYYLQIKNIKNFHNEAFSLSQSKKEEKISTEEAESVDQGPTSDIVSGTLSLGAFLLAFRIARSWNRTGDKWAHLPDVGDWLVRPDNKIELSLLCFMSLCAISLIRWRRGITWFCSNLLLAGSIGVYLFRAATGALIFQWVYGTAIEKGETEARIVYFVVLFGVYHALSTYWKAEPQLQIPSNKNKSNALHICQRSMVFSHLQIAWTIMMLLLYRPHNIPLVLLITIMEVCLHHIVLQCADGLPTWAVTLLYTWMGHATFFLQGNSNSISSVDVSAGYIGLTDYQPMIIGLLLCLSTYAGHIFWIISLMKTLSEICFDNRVHNYQWEYLLDEVTRTLLLTRALPLAFYTCLTTLQRYHLFVWTVFSPKLLYEGMLTVVMVSLVLLLQLCHKLS